MIKLTVKDKTYNLETVDGNLILNKYLEIGALAATGIIVSIVFSYFSHKNYLETGSTDLGLTLLFAIYIICTFIGVIILNKRSNFTLQRSNNLHISVNDNSISINNQKISKIEYSNVVIKKRSEIFSDINFYKIFFTTESYIEYILNLNNTNFIKLKKEVEQISKVDFEDLGNLKTSKT